MQLRIADLLKHAVVLFFGVILAALLIPSITYHGLSDLFLAALVLALLNALLKPILVLFVLPLIIFTLGLGLVLVNATLLYLSSAIVPGFTVATFWGAIFGAVIVSISNAFALMLFLPRRQGLRIRIRNSHPNAPRPPRKSKKNNSDVIDV